MKVNFNENIDNDIYNIDFNYLKEHNLPFFTFANYDDLENYIINSEYANKIMSQSSKYTRLYEQKRSSEIYGLLYKNKKDFERQNITLDTAITLLSTLYNYYRVIFDIKTLSKVPVRMLSKRANNLSRFKIDFMLKNFKRLGLIELKFYNGEPWAKLKARVLRDGYIKEKSKSSYIADSNTYYSLTCKNSVGSLFFNKLTKETLYRNLREFVFGISFAYTKMFEREILGETRYHDQKEFGKRGDITYLVIPVPIIANILNTSEQKIFNYLYKLTTCSRYLAKHDLVYVDSKDKTEGNYYETTYKHFDKLDLVQAILSEEHPTVNEFSYIVFNNEFKGTRTEKNIKKREDNYEQTLLYYLKYNDKELYEIADNEGYILDSDYNNTQFDKIASRYDGVTYYERSSNYVDSFYIEDTNKKNTHYSNSCQNYQAPLKFSSKKLSFQYATKMIKAVMKRMNFENDNSIETSDRDFNRYKNIITKCINFIQKTINEALADGFLGRVDSYKRVLLDLNILYCFKNI